MEPGVVFFISVWVIIIFGAIIINFIQNQQEKGNDPAEQLVIRLVIGLFLFSIITYLIKTSN